MLDFGFYNMDCMEGMKEFPDNYFDLAIVDPPYGNPGGGWKSKDGTRFGQRFDRYREPGSVAKHTREAAPAGVGPNTWGGYDITRSDSERAAEITRTGGTWAAKFGKKSPRGI